MASMCSLQLVRVRGLPYEVQVPPIDPVQRCHLPGHLAFGRSSSFFPSGKFSVQNVRSPRSWDQGCVSTQGVLKVRCAINQPISMGLTQPKEMAVVLLKVASVLCARATKVIYDRQLFLQCAPAVGLMIFAMWGLGPLLRVIHHLVLQKEDRHWKGSQTYYIMNSYLRPFMLWIGVIAVCRAFDPVVLSTEASQAIKQRFLNFVRSLSTVLAFASCAASLTQQLQKLMVEGQDKHDSQRVGAQFIGNAVYTAIWIAAVCLFMELLGFSTQKWLTAGGLGTVLLTLAGREIFTNFLSGVMIHATRPFVENEWIQTKIEGYEVSGTVEHVGWWSPTIIRGDDREAVHIPNHKFTVSVVRNLSQKTHWRIKTHFGISHLDVSKITNIVSDMRKVLAKHPQVEQKRLHRRVFFDNINPENQALLILVSCFVKTSHFEEYLRVKEIILLDLLKVISHHHARLATPIRSVQRISEDSDSRHSSFRDMSSRSAEASPYLLIEATSIASGQREVEQSTNGIYGVSNNKEGFEAGKLESEAGTSTTAGENDNAAESNSNLKSQVKQKEHGSSEVRPRSGATSTEAAYLSATTKPQLEGLDSMGLNSKDITLLGAAFEKPPAKIPEGPVDSGPYVDIPQGDKAVSRAPADPLSQAAGAKVVARSSTDQFPQVAGAKVVSRSVDELSQAAAAEADKLSTTVDGIDATLSGEKEKEKKDAKEGTMGVEITVQNRTEGDLWMDTRRPSSHGTSASLAPSSPKQENDRLPPGINSVSRPQLEDNLVLGVALDGPKRTLRLDDAAVPPSEKKTLVTSRNGNVNTAVKDRQDSAQSTSPTAAPSDVRDRDR